MHPIQITLPQTINPILGSLMGWALGVSPLPDGVPTYMGGAMLLVATVLVLTAAQLREARQQANVQQCHMDNVSAIASKPCITSHNDSFWDDDAASVELRCMSGPEHVLQPSQLHGTENFAHEAGGDHENTAPDWRSRRPLSAIAIGMTAWLAKWKGQGGEAGQEIALQHETDALLPSAPAEVFELQPCSFEQASDIRIALTKASPQAGSASELQPYAAGPRTEHV